MSLEKITLIAGMKTVQFSLVAQSCPTLCDPMDYRTPGFPVHHQLLELTQTHVHWVSDAIQSSHPLSSPSPSAFNLSQHQGLFWRVSSSRQVGKVLELRLQHQSFQWIFRVGFLQDWLVWSPCSPRDSQEFSPAPQFESLAFFMVWRHMTTGKIIASTTWISVSKVMSLLFNTLSRFVIAFLFCVCVIAFLPRSVFYFRDFGAQENKICHCFHFFPHLFAMKW